MDGIGIGFRSNWRQNQFYVTVKRKRMNWSSKGIFLFFFFKHFDKPSPAKKYILFKAGCIYCITIASTILMFMVRKDPRSVSLHYKLFIIMNSLSAFGDALVTNPFSCICASWWHSMEASVMSFRFLLTGIVEFYPSLLPEISTAD